MTAQGVRLGTIGQIHVTVTDLDRAVAFYRDALGIPFLFAYPGMAFFDCGGVRLFLGPAENDQFSGRATLYFTVADIDEAVLSLTFRGVAFDKPPQFVHRADSYTLWMAFTQDPDGNNIGLMSEVLVAAS